MVQNFTFFHNSDNFVMKLGPEGDLVVKALRYKSEGPGIDPRW
jgi:hypothetical protein